MIAPIQFHAPAPAQAQINVARFLACIVAVEGNRWPAPGGAYGLSRACWSQNSSLPYRYSSLPIYALHVAELHVAWLERSLRQLDQPVTAYTLAACYRFGLEGGVAAMHRGRVDYAERCENLYLSSK